MHQPLVKLRREGKQSTTNYANREENEGATLPQWESCFLLARMFLLKGPIFMCKQKNKNHLKGLKCTYGKLASYTISFKARENPKGHEEQSPNKQQTSRIGSCSESNKVDIWSNYQPNLFQLLFSSCKYKISHRIYHLKQNGLVWKL